MGLREEGITADFPSSHETRMVLESLVFRIWCFRISKVSQEDLVNHMPEAEVLKAWFKP